MPIFQVTPTELKSIYETTFGSEGPAHHVYVQRGDMIEKSSQKTIAKGEIDAAQVC